MAFTEGLGEIEMTMRNDPIGDGGPVGVLTNLDENGELIPPDDPPDGVPSRQRTLALGRFVQARTVERLTAGGKGRASGRRRDGIRQSLRRLRQLVRREEKAS